MTDKNEREIALAATPGPWKADLSGLGHVSDNEDTVIIAQADTYPDNTYIAMANPARWLELLNTIESLKCCGNCDNWNERDNGCNKSDGFFTGDEICNDWTQRGDKE